MQGEYREPRRGPGTVSWVEHLEAHAVYAGSYRAQDAEDIARRGGFGYDEITKLLGHEPTTWGTTAQRCYSRRSETMSDHHCHAFNCDVSTPPRLFMCRRHWAMVPKVMQDAVWAAYTPGQERNLGLLRPEYLDAARAARFHVRELEKLAS